MQSTLKASLWWVSCRSGCGSRSASRSGHSGRFMDDERHTTGSDAMTTRRQFLAACRAFARRATRVLAGRRPTNRSRTGPPASASRPTPSGSSRTRTFATSRSASTSPREMGFDGVEILHRQMKDESTAATCRSSSSGRSSTACRSAASRRTRVPLPEEGGAAEERRSHDPLHRAGLRDGHPDHARQHRHLGHEQELRRADEEPRHRAAAAGLHRRRRLRVGDRRPDRVPARPPRSAA